MLSISKPSINFVQFLLEGYDKRILALLTFYLFIFYFSIPNELSRPSGQTGYLRQQGLLNFIKKAEAEQEDFLVRSFSLSAGDLPLNSQLTVPILTIASISALSIPDSGGVGKWILPLNGYTRD